MSHPDREEWMSYLYGELPRASRSGLETHLKQCADCRQRVAEWRQTMGALDRWELPPARSANRAQPFFHLRWAVAALFALGLGLGLGRFSAPTRDQTHPPTTLTAALQNSFAQELRRQIAAELQEEMQSRIATAQQQLGGDLNNLADATLTAANLQARELLTAYDQRLEAANRTLRNQVENLDGRQTRLAKEFAALRRETETVALLTEDGFRQTQQQMYRLASYTTAENPNPAGAGSARRP